MNDLHHRNIKLKTILYLTVIIISALSLTTLKAEIYFHQMKYLTAAQIIPIIKPHLKSETGITAKGFQLIIQSSPEEYKKIKQIVSTLDKKPGEYLAEVRIINRQLTEQELQHTQVSISYQPASKNSVHIQSKHYQSGKNNKNDRRFTLRITENNQGFVNTGESFPTHQLVRRYDSFVSKPIQQKVSSGFYIRINQLPNNDIRVAIKTYSQSRDRTKSIQQSSADIVANGAKNTWILLASTGETKTSHHSKDYSSERRQSDKQWYYLRVTDVKR